MKKFILFLLLILMCPIIVFAEEMVVGEYGKYDDAIEYDGIYANAAHTHKLEDITGLFDNVYTEDEVDAFLASKSDSTHLHDDVYYTQDQVDEKIKSGIDGVDLSGLATKKELEQGLALKSDLGHGHEMNQINGLQDELNKKKDLD